MQTVATHVKKIDKQTMITNVLNIGEVIESLKGTRYSQVIRKNLETSGVLITDDHIYHVIDSPKSMGEILNKSTRFEMRDGQILLVKPNGIGFMGVITGIDDEGMNVVIAIEQIDSYRVMGGDLK